MKNAINPTQQAASSAGLTLELDDCHKFLQHTLQTTTKCFKAVNIHNKIVVTLAFWTGLPLESSFMSTVDVMISAFNN